jgi:hypothetical protein
MNTALRFIAFFILAIGALAVWLVAELRTLDNAIPNQEPRTPNQEPHP